MTFTITITDDLTGIVVHKATIRRPAKTFDIKELKKMRLAPMPGVQAQRRKFIAFGSYFTGRIEEARGSYQKYLASKENAYSRGVYEQVLSWEGFLHDIWSKEKSQSIQ